ncbi:MAG TPA: hypothetical protein PLY73_11365, partial [Candidatus Ozemobacteraceae bacterium]|nr:hypothetical protein [Candidatus Ozemobacteraceae bacterium]
MPFSSLKPGRSPLTAFIYCVLLLFPACQTDAGIEYRISTVNGTWLMNMTTTLIQGEINGKPEVVCLPRIEFTSELDRE